MRYSLPEAVYNSAKSLSRRMVWRDPIKNDPHSYCREDYLQDILLACVRADLKFKASDRPPEHRVPYLLRAASNARYDLLRYRRSKLEKATVISSDHAVNSRTESPRFDERIDAQRLFARLRESLGDRKLEFMMEAVSPGTENRTSYQRNQMSTMRAQARMLQV